MNLSKKSRKATNFSTVRDLEILAGHVKAIGELLNDYVLSLPSGSTREFSIKFANVSKYNDDHKNINFDILDQQEVLIAKCAIHLDVSDSSIQGQLVFVKDAMLSFGEMESYIETVCYLVGRKTYDEEYEKSLRDFKVSVGVCAWDLICKANEPNLPQIVVNNDFQNFSRIEKSELEHVGFFEGIA
jgi:hypothetical protein